MEEKNMYPLWSKKFWLLLVSVLILGTIVVVSILRDRIVNYPQWTVSIVGQGKISINPDIAKVTLGIETSKMANAAEAYRVASQTMNKITEAVKAFGIEEKDIQTTNYSLTPNYQYYNGENSLTGYQATQEITLTLRDLQKLSPIIEKTTSAGANRISNVVFTVENMDQVKNEARLKAIADAKQKSTDYAQAVGVKLGEVTGWWENVVQVPYQAYNSYVDGKGGMGGGAGSYTSAGQIPYGPLDVVVEMNLNYRIR